MSNDVLTADFIPADVTFALSAPGAYTVSVVIFFNQCPEDSRSPTETSSTELNPKDQVMVRDLVRLSEVQPGEWRCAVPLPPGWFEYLFLVDGEWALDPEAPAVQPDGAGGLNSIRLVEAVTTST